MPLQDLTPQLRTRLNRMERAVGWFITVATLILIAGFGYYLYNTAQQRGWFEVKARYFVYVEQGDGLKVGDDVKLMGFRAGRILAIKPMPPTWGERSTNNVYVEFDVTEENFGYIWTDDSRVNVKTSGLLDKRELDIIKGLTGFATVLTWGFRDDLTLAEARTLPHLDKWRLGQEIRDGTNIVFKPWSPLSNSLERIGGLLGTNLIHAIDISTKKHAVTAVWNGQTRAYDRFTKTTGPHELPRFEEPPITERLQAMITQIQAALPGVFQLTNQIAAVLSNTALATSNLNLVLAEVRPTVTNLAVITGNLRNPVGSLGEWLIPTNLNHQLDTTLQTAQGTLTNVDANLITLNRSLDNLANITSNLNNQVQANTNILSNISSIVVHSDEFIQGLKKFWLFRHLFAAHPAPGATPPAKTNERLVSPKQKGR